MRNSTRGDVDPFIVMDVMEAARAAEAEGRHIIHMEVGQPGAGAPQAALDKLRTDLSDPLGYTVGLGLPALRERIAQHYGEWYDLDLDPQRVIITSGASGAFLLAFSALFDSGERVGLGLPGYPSYRHILKALGLTPVGIRTRPDARYQPEPGDVARHNLDGLIVASPANPTGSILSAPALQALASECQAQGAAFISDEIYHGITYTGDQATALGVTDQVYVINSFSKYFAMTGWRVGWMVVPDDHVQRVERLAQNMFICAPHAAQRLALHTFDAQDELQAHLHTYAANRELVLSGLAAAGFSTIAPPDGAFYVYADASAFTENSVRFARELLDNADIAVTPGLDFDPDEGHRWLRFSYAGTTDDMAEGMARLQRYMAGR